MCVSTYVHILYVQYYVHMYSTYVCIYTVRMCTMYSMYTCAYVCTVRMCTYTPRTVCTQRTRTERIIVSTSTLVNKKMSPWARFYRPPPPCFVPCSAAFPVVFWRGSSSSNRCQGMLLACVEYDYVRTCMYSIALTSIRLCPTYLYKYIVHFFFPSH